MGALGASVGCDDLTWPFSPHNPTGDSKDICSSYSLPRVHKAGPGCLSIEEEQRPAFVGAGEPLIDGYSDEAIPQFAGEHTPCDESGSWSIPSTRAAYSVLMPEEGVTFLGCRRDAVGRGWARGWRGPGMAEGCLFGCCTGQQFSAPTFANSDVITGRLTAVEFSDCGGFGFDGGGSLSRSLNTIPTLTRCSDGFCLRYLGLGLRGRCGCSETLGYVMEGDTAAMNANDRQVTGPAARDRPPDLLCSNTLTKNHALEECLSHEVEVLLQKQGLEDRSALPSKHSLEKDMQGGATGQCRTDSGDVGFVPSTLVDHEAQEEHLQQRRRQHQSKSSTEKVRRQHQGRQQPSHRRAGCVVEAVKAGDWGAYQVLPDVVDALVKPGTSGDAVVCTTRESANKTTSETPFLTLGVAEQQPQALWTFGGGPPFSSSKNGTAEIHSTSCGQMNSNIESTVRVRTRKTNTGVSAGKGSRSTGGTTTAREAGRAVHAKSLISKPPQRRRYTQQQRRGWEVYVGASDQAELHTDAPTSSMPLSICTETPTGASHGSLTARVEQSQGLTKIEWQTSPLLAGHVQTQTNVGHPGAGTGGGVSRETPDTDTTSLEGIAFDHSAGTLGSALGAFGAGTSNATTCSEASMAVAASATPAVIAGAAGAGGSRRKSRAVINGPASSVTGWEGAELSSIANGSQTALVSGPAPSTWHEQPNAGLLLSSAFSYLSVKNAEPLFSSRWKSGCEGVYFDYQKGLWRVQFLQDGRRRTKSFSPKHLGSSEAAKFAAMVYRIKMVETQDNVCRKIEELNQEWSNAQAGVVGGSSTAAEVTPEGQQSELATVESFVDLQGQQAELAVLQSTSQQHNAAGRQSSQQQQQQQQQPECSSTTWKVDFASFTGAVLAGLGGRSGKDSSPNNCDASAGLYSAERGSVSANAAITEGFVVPATLEGNAGEDIGFSSLPPHVDNSLQSWCPPSVDKTQVHMGALSCSRTFEGGCSSGMPVCSPMNSLQHPCFVPITKVQFAEYSQVQQSTREQQEDCFQQAQQQQQQLCSRAGS